MLFIIGFNRVPGSYINQFAWKLISREKKNRNTFLFAARNRLVKNVRFDNKYIRGNLLWLVMCKDSMISVK